jgi:hypothetical protein
MLRSGSGEDSPFRHGACGHRGYEQAAVNSVLFMCPLKHVWALQNFAGGGP